MCRATVEGGRRCPAHTDPAKVQAYNSRRRELYAARHNKNFVASHPPISFIKQFNRLAEEYENLLTDQEKDALHEYTDISYTDIKDYLYGKDINLDDNDFDASEIKEMKKQIKLIDSALSKAIPPEEDRVLYRGIKIPGHVEDASIWLAENYPVGAIIKKKGYLSTSVNPTVALQSYMGINDSDITDYQTVCLLTFSSKRGAPISSNLSAFEDEHEILIGRDQKFKVEEIISDATVSVDSKGKNIKTVIIKLTDV